MTRIAIVQATASAILLVVGLDHWFARLAAVACFAASGLVALSASEERATTPAPSSRKEEA